MAPEDINALELRSKRVLKYTLHVTRPHVAQLLFAECVKLPHGVRGERVHFKCRLPFGSTFHSKHHLDTLSKTHVAEEF